jgi:hypothetical protein
MTDHVWFKPFARAGYGARGLVYSVIGSFTLLAGLGAGQETDSRGALETILDSPARDVVAVVLIVGLASYALWRTIQSLADTDRHGWSAKGAAIRGGLLASAVTYSVLTVFTFGLWRGTSDNGGSDMGEPVTQAIAGFVGSQVVSLGLTAVFLGVAVAHISKAYKGSFEKHFEASQRVMTFAHPIARIGLTARGLVFLVLAFLTFYRGLSAGDGGTPGLSEALDFIKQLPLGGLLLGAMGIGLVAFALYSFLQAGWRRINVENADGIR